MDYFDFFHPPFSSLATIVANGLSVNQILLRRSPPIPPAKNHLDILRKRIMPIIIVIQPHLIRKNHRSVALHGNLLHGTCAAGTWYQAEVSAHPCNHQQVYPHNRHI